MRMMWRADEVQQPLIPAGLAVTLRQVDARLNTVTARNGHQCVTSAQGYRRRVAPFDSGGRRQGAEAFGFSLPPVPIFHEADNASQKAITYLTHFGFVLAQ